MECSVCSSQITERYCPSCGQYFKAEKITSISLLKDIFGGIFSVEKSLYNNVKLAFVDPRILVTNYWNGFRRYHFSPGRFLAIAALFFVIQLMVGNDFLGIVVSSSSSKQFTLLLVNILLFSITSVLAYIAHKRNFYEHIVLNIYLVSFWSIIFVPISLVLEAFNVSNQVNNLFILIYWILIVVWTARVFNNSMMKRVGYAILQSSLIAIIIGLIYRYGISY